MQDSDHDSATKPAVAKGRAPARLSKKARAKLFAYIEKYPNRVLVSTAANLSDVIGVSDAAIIRAIQALGYEGLPHLKAVIAARLDAGTRDAPDKVSVTLETLRARDHASPFELTVEAYARSLEWLRYASTKSAVAAAVSCLAHAPRIALYGVGPSNQLMQQTAIHLNRIGHPAYSLIGTVGTFADSLLQIGEKDALLALAYGQVQKEGELAKQETRARGGAIVVITDNPTGRMADDADAVIIVPRTEVGNMTMYGTILMTLEAIVLSLTREYPERALSTAQRLKDFRAELAVPLQDEKKGDQ
ncbi:MurR/RpiR family transcriptional regulator (plasmid) [Nitrobacteraceae bacterium UC4446_H13]